jgi:hypothetical protein
VLNWKQQLEIAKVIQPSEEKSGICSGAEGTGKIWRQMPQKECFSLSMFCGSHDPDALYVSHLEMRT